jgi:hypothetical protein
VLILVVYKNKAVLDELSKTFFESKRKGRGKLALLSLPFFT